MPTVPSRPSFRLISYPNIAHRNKPQLRKESLVNVFVLGELASSFLDKTSVDPVMVHPSHSSAQQPGQEHKQASEAMQSIHNFVTQRNQYTSLSHIYYEYMQ